MKFSFVWILLISAFLFSRIFNLRSLPLFSDEGYAVARAWDLKNTGEFFGMVKYTTQPIFIWLIALFQFLPFDDVISGRLVSGIFGLGTALIISKLAGKWVGRKAAIPAFILMAILPFSVFYDRTILFESTTLFFMVLALVFPVATGLAVLTKQTGWLILPLVLALGGGSLRGRTAKVLISILMVLAVWYLAMGNFNFAPISVSANFKNNLLRSKLWLIDYLTWPVIWLSVLGGLAAVLEAFRKKKITPILIAAGWILGIFLFINKTAVIFYPRYLYSILLGIVLLAVKGWTEVVELILRFGRRDRLTMMGIATISFLVLMPSLISSLKIIAAPTTANVPLEDRFQFFEDWTSGVGTEEMVKFVESQGSHPSYGKTTIFFEEENSYYVNLLSTDSLENSIYIKMANWLQDPLSEIPKEILADDSLSFLVRNRHPDIPADWPVELIWSFPKTDARSVYLYKILK